jgi:glycerol-3-phosphate acyltransferase PlsY
MPDQACWPSLFTLSWNEMPLTPPLFLIGAYLLGSLPTAYLIARWLRGIDLREVGSGNVGGSNLRATVGSWATVAVGLFDVAKGALPVWLAQQVGLGETTAIGAGLAAVAGHNWSPWLSFQGGRGMASTLGVLLVLFPAGLAWVLGALALGAMAGQVPLLHGLGVLSLPLLSLGLSKTSTITRMAVALVGIMVIKRLEANQGRRALTPSQRRVWLTRLLHDRDQY